MRKTLGIILRVVVVLITVLWMSLIIMEYIRYKDNEPMLIVLKEETLSYKDGHVYVYYGLGYKSITYNRNCLYGKQFGHIFTKVQGCDDDDNDNDE